MSKFRQLTDIRLRLTIPIVCWLTFGCAGPAVRSDLSEEERKEDLSFLATVFAERERSFTAESRAEFEKRLAVVESSVGSISHHAFIAGIQWTVAAAGSLEPEVPIPLVFGDYAPGRDPVMVKLPSLLGAGAP